MRLCIVTPSPPGVSETFIRAHLERLQHDIIHLHGPIHDYSYGEQRIRECFQNRRKSPFERSLNLFPRYLEFRLRQHYFPEASEHEIAADFLRLQKIDLVLAEYGTVGAQITAACKLTGVPLVAHFHGFDASRYDILHQYAQSYREMFDYANSIISVSGAMSSSLIALGCPDEKIHLNPYGPAPSFFNVIPNYESNTLLAVGRHTAKKAPYLTLDAFRRARVICPELRLCFIGAGELMEVSERLVDAWELSEFVELVGAADSRRVEEAMSNAFGFLQHSVQAENGDSEGTPVAILEAGAAGLPVIATAHAGIPEVVEHGKTGFIVEPGDVQCMAERIVELTENRDLVYKMGQAARQRISKHFTMERHILDLDSILRLAAENGVNSKQAALWE